MEAKESAIYKELDFFELKRQRLSRKFEPVVGVNDAPFKNPYNGNVICFPLENNLLYNLYEESFKRYDKNKADPDIQRLCAIK